MKTKRINQNIYKYSQTLYGAERLKLILQSLYELDEKGGKYTLDDVPDICAMFEDRHEYLDYLKLHVNHLVVNLIMIPMLGEIHHLCFGSIMSIKYFNSKKDDDIDIKIVKGLYRKVLEFFAILKFVEDLNKEYKIELFTHHNRKTVDRHIEFMERMKEFCLASFKLEGVEFDDEQGAHDFIDYIERLFNLFQTVAEK